MLSISEIGYRLTKDGHAFVHVHASLQLLCKWMLAKIIVHNDLGYVV